MIRGVTYETVREAAQAHGVSEGYVKDLEFEVLSPAEAKVVHALRAGNALPSTTIQITGDGNQAAGRDLNHSQGAKSEGRKGRKPRNPGT